jgi:hypothetical protein
MRAAAFEHVGKCSACFAEVTAMRRAIFRREVLWISRKRGRCRDHIGGLDAPFRLNCIYDSSRAMILMSPTVVEAMKLGASDFITKPVNETALEAVLKNTFEKDLSESAVRESDLTKDNLTGFVTLNGKVRRIAEITKRVAPTDVPILILGESGVGKEVLARYAHVHSGRYGAVISTLRAMPASCQMGTHGRGFRDTTGCRLSARNGNEVIPSLGQWPARVPVDQTAWLCIPGSRRRWRNLDPADLKMQQRQLPSYARRARRRSDVFLQSMHTH